MYINAARFNISIFVPGEIATAADFDDVKGQGERKSGSGSHFKQ